MKTFRELEIKESQDDYNRMIKYIRNRDTELFKIFDDAMLYEFSNGKAGSPLPKLGLMDDVCECNCHE